MVAKRVCEEQADQARADGPSGDARRGVMRRQQRFGTVGLALQVMA